MGQLNFPVQASPVWGDQSGRGQDLINAIENRAWVLGTILNHSTRGEMMLGFWPTTTLDNAPNFALYTLSNEIRARIASTTSGNDAGYSAATDYPIIVVWLNGGYQAFSKRGGIWYRDWMHSQVHASAYAGFSNYSAAGSLQDKWIIQSQKADLFDPEIFVESPAVGTGSNNGAYPEAPAFDFFMQYVVDTLPASGNIRVSFRWQWNPPDYIGPYAPIYDFVQIDSAGNIELYDHYEGLSDFLLATGSSGVSNGDTITVIAENFNRKVWVNETLVIDYNDADYSDSNQESTNWEVVDLGSGGVISDLTIAKYKLRDIIGLSDNLIVNGTFDADTDWTKGANWTIAAGVANHTGANSLLQAMVDPAIAEHIYYCEMEILNYVSGGLAAKVGTPSFPFYGIAFGQNDGVTSGYRVAEASGQFYLESFSSFSGDVDNVILKEVLFSSSYLAQILDSILGL